MFRRAKVALILALPLSTYGTGLGCIFTFAIGESKTIGLTCCAGSNGYRTELTKQVPGVMFTNVEAVNGIGVAGIRLQIDGFLATQSATPAPTLAIINLGTSDLISGIPAQSDFETWYLYILDAIHVKWPGCSVLIVKPWYPAAAANAAVLAGWIDNVVAARQPWTNAGVNEANFLNGAGMLSADNIHPSPNGYVATATAIRQAIGF